MIKSTRCLKISQKHTKLLINLLRQFEIAYKLSPPKQKVGCFKELVFTELIRLTLDLDLPDLKKEAKKSATRRASK
jgi:hypothetical protein